MPQLLETSHSSASPDDAPALARGLSDLSVSSFAPLPSHPLVKIRLSRTNQPNAPRSPDPREWRRLARLRRVYASERAATEGAAESSVAALGRAADTSERPIMQNDPLTPVYSRLANLATLHPDWNTPDGQRPARVAIQGAIRLAQEVYDRTGYVLGSRALPTAILPLPSGGLEVEWKSGDEMIMGGVSPDGEWGYLRKIGSGRAAKYEEEEGVSEESLLDLITTVISQWR
jgi:hypothetical protein